MKKFLTSGRLLYHEPLIHTSDPKRSTTHSSMPHVGAGAIILVVRICNPKTKLERRTEVDLDARVPR